MNLKEKYSHFAQLIECNNQALNALSSIRNNIRTTTECLEDIIFAPFFGVMENIKAMAECYYNMCHTAERERIDRRIENIEEQALSTIRTLQVAVQFDYADSDVETQMEEELFSRVERLTNDMRDANAKTFTIENAETPHDLIRYFHQVGVDSMFDMSLVRDKYSGHRVEVNLKNDASMYIIDLEEKLGPLNGEGFQNPQNISCKPLKAIVEFYNSDKAEEKESSESFKAMVIGNRLIAQVQLGCHYSEIDAQIGGDNNFIKFMFRDTPRSSYPNSRDRTHYVRRVLKRLGFKVTGEGEETRAVMENKPEEHTYKTFMEILRFSASTRDLDTSNSKVGKYPNRAVNAFFEGVVNIHEYLHKYAWGFAKDDKE